MIMNDPKKKMVSVIAAKLGKPEMQEKPKNEMGDELDQSHGFRAAAEELLAAIESKSASGVQSALKSFYEMCSNEEPEASEE